MAAALTAAKPRSLGLLAFVSLAFFSTAGGPAGTEISILSGGAGLTFLALLIVPILYALPQALIAAELACRYPSDGGPALWLRAAFGDIGAWLIGLNSAVSAVLDLALYPLLFSESLSLLVGGVSATAKQLTSFAVILAGLTCNALGIDRVSDLSGVLAVAVMLPYVLSFVAQLPKVFVAGNSAWAQSLPSSMTARFDVWAASMLWSYSGYDAVSAFAGQVIDPQTTFIRGLLITMLLATLSYAIPLLTAVQTHPDITTWAPGCLQVFCADVHPLLGVFAAVSALLSQMGMFQAGLSSSSRAIWALAGGVEADSIKRGSQLAVAHLPRFLATEWQREPIAALLTQCAIVAVLVTLPFESLLTVNLLLGAFRVLLIAAAFLKLRGQQQQQQKHAAAESSGGYVVPGGWAGATAVALPLVLVSCWFLSIAHPSAVRPAVALNVLGLLIFAMRVFHDRLRYGVFWPRGQWNLAASSLSKDKATPKAALRSGSSSPASSSEGDDMPHIALGAQSPKLLLLRAFDDHESSSSSSEPQGGDAMQGAAVRPFPVGVLPRELPAEAGSAATPTKGRSR